jgi:biopolymer transport protein TolQ
MDFLSLPVMVTEVGIAGGLRADVLDLALHAGTVVKLVLLTLLLFSVFSWAIIIVKFRVLRLAEKETKGFLSKFWASKDFSKSFMEAKRLSHSPVATLFRSGYIDVEKIRKERAGSSPSRAASDFGARGGLMEGVTAVERTLKRVSGIELTRLEKTLTFLATTGNATPFIGLFGTVWGIMDAFRQIGFKGSTSLAVVAPGISEALIATAAGLFAAIPAVVAYNYFLNKIRVLSTQMESFSAEFLNIVDRHFRNL